MSSTNETKLFLEHCKMTCFGGSEKGLCACSSPEACELVNHPRYEHYRKEAKTRMFRFLKGAGDPS